MSITTGTTAGPAAAGDSPVVLPVIDEAPPAVEIDPRLLVDSPGLRGSLSSFGRRVRGGDLGSLPVIVGVIVIWALFQSQNSNFLTAFNLSNLAQDMCATGVISVGIVLVLLLGEVDLSAGSVSGASSAVLVVLVVNHNLGSGYAVVAAVAVGAAIGCLQGAFFARIGVPAFIVTLAGLIGWSGLQLYVLGAQGTINLPQKSFVRSLGLDYLGATTGWVLAAATIAVYAALQLLEIRNRKAADLRPRPIAEVVIRVLVVGVVLFAAVAVLNHNEGVPRLLLVLLVLVVVVDVVIRRTRYGRHILAVGGNIEAARRAGINVSFIRISVFALSGGFAAVGGILAAARLGSVNQSSGGNSLLLNAIAAAVIGGTSLFGGRGSAYSALLGVVVIQSISNGIDLLNYSSSTRLMITGAVTLAAVTLDAVSRRGQRSAGRV